MGKPITITADEDDLRATQEVLARNVGLDADANVYEAIAAALPAPRIHPQPGDLLRMRNDDKRWTVVGADANGVWIIREDLMRLTAPHHLPHLNSDEWDIIRAADLPWERA